MSHDCKAIACFTFNFYLYSVDATWKTTFKPLKELAHLFVVYPYYETHVDCFIFFYLQTVQETWWCVKWWPHKWDNYAWCQLWPRTIDPEITSLHYLTSSSPLFRWHHSFSLLCTWRHSFSLCYVHVRRIVPKVLSVQSRLMFGAVTAPHGRQQHQTDPAKTEPTSRQYPPTYSRSLGSTHQSSGANNDV